MLVRPYIMKPRSKNNEKTSKYLIINPYYILYYLSLTQTHIHIHIHVYTYTYIHTHTHTHTHTYIYKIHKCHRFVSKVWVKVFKLDYVSWIQEMPNAIVINPDRLAKENYYNWHVWYRNEDWNTGWAKWNGMYMVQLSWDTEPNIYFTGQCHVLVMLYLMSSDSYVTVIKGVICMQADLPSH